MSPRGRARCLRACFLAAVALVVAAVASARRHELTLVRDRTAVPVGTAPRPAGALELPGQPGSAARTLVRSGTESPIGPSAPHVAFRYRAGGAVTSPVALDARGRIYLTSHDGLLHALGANGRLRFRRRLDAPGEGGGQAPAPAWGGPAVTADGRVWAGSDAGWLHAFDADDGRVLHALRFEGPVDRTPVPLPDGGLLVVSGARVTRLGPDLEPRWHFDAWDKIFARPAVDPRGRVYVASQDDFLHVLQPDGRLGFRHRADADLDAAPLWTAGRVYLGSDAGRVHALDDAGSTRWVVDVGGYVRAPLVRGPADDVLAVTFGPTPRVVALRTRDGSVRWSFSPGPIDSSERGFASAPCVDGAGHVYVGGHDDHLYALGPAGTLRFALPVRGDVSGAPVLREDGTLIFGTESGLIYGVRDPR